MPLQDLTPQLRTRLTRMERTVGWFLSLALLLLLASFLAYLYQAADQRGWFKIKAQFVTYVKSAASISKGDPVTMMGFPIGVVLSVEPPPPRVPQDVKVVFEVQEPYYRYIWTEGSHVKTGTAGLLGQRQLEVTRATNGFALCSTHPLQELDLAEITRRATEHPGRWQLFQNVYDANSNLVLRAYAQLVESNADGTLDTTNLSRLAALNLTNICVYDNQVKRHRIVSVWNRARERYEENTGEPVALAMAETPALTDRIDQIIAQVQAALPGILAVTNRINKVLDNTANVTSNLNTVVVAAQPLVTNVGVITGNLRTPGSLGTWVLNTNGLTQITLALTNANTLLTNVNTLLGHTDTNLDALTQDIGVTLIHLGNITSNLDTQVANNPQAMSNVVKAIADTDDLIQGLKRHWLLRSAFKTKKTNAPPVKASPK